MARTASARFLRSSYWRRWSRILTDRHMVGMPLERRAGSSGSTVEIDLEPHGGWDKAAGWEPTVRVHLTARDGRDTVADALPIDAEVALTAHLGHELAAWLLDPETEILGKIDWNAVKRLNNGGAPLRACLLPRFADDMPAARPSAAAARIADHYNLPVAA